MLEILQRNRCVCQGYAIFVAISVFSVTVVEAQVYQRTQEELAAALRSSDLDQVAAALEAMPLVRGQHGRVFPPDFTISSELASALLYAFEKGLEGVADAACNRKDWLDSGKSFAKAVSA